MTEPTKGPWLRMGRTVYELTETDKGEPVNLWSAHVQGGGPFAATEAEMEDVARLIAKARCLPVLVDALEGVRDWADEYDVPESPFAEVRAALALVQETE